MFAAFLEGLFYLVFFGSFALFAMASRKRSKRKKKENVLRHQKIARQKRTVDFALHNGSSDN